MFCNSGCGGFFGVGVGRMPRNLPFVNGCGCNNGCGCGFDNGDNDYDYEPARGGCGCNR